MVNEKRNKNQLKRVIFIFSCLLFVSLSYAQEGKKGAPNLPAFDEKKLHFGFLIGFNTMDFRIYNSGQQTDDGNTYYSEVLDLKPGLNIGIVTSLRLNKYFNLRFLPGISFGERDIYYMNQNGEFQENSPLQIKSTFLEFPLLVKFSGSRMHNVKPFMIAGANMKYDLAKNKQDHLLLRSLDLYGEAGAGLDFYMTYFRLSLELRASVGMFDVLNPAGTGEPGDEVYTQALDGLKSRIFVLTFYFE